VRLLVAPHELAIGGSQINAIDLAAGAAAAGHEVLVYGVPGPLVGYVEQCGLEYIPARRLKYRPAPSRVAQLAALARSRKLDLIHAYEWPPCLDAYYGAHLLLGVPLVCTVLSMSVSPLVPSSVPLIMGTEALGDEARRTHGAPVWVLEPPIDTVGDHPGIDGAGFRSAWGVGSEQLLVVSVSRLAVDLKLDALVRAIDACDLLAGELPVQLMLVGGGPAEGPLRERAAAVNGRHGREVVRFTGPLTDPRTAYAAADVVVGMGSSALRAAAIGRPVVVQGEQAFSEVLAPAGYPHFLRHGFWGLGDDAPDASRLAAQLRPLLRDPALRAELGAFGRRAVEEDFSLRRGTARQLEIYGEVLAARRRRRVSEAVATAGRALALEVENHDPRRKRVRHGAEAALLAAAGRRPTTSEALT
jgi:glycosyltransferase involved in cell wall biosynthesis